jgi:tRNA 2-selenouridine synthase
VVICASLNSNFLPVDKLHIDEFLRLAHSHPILDARSPAEYRQAHIPGAYNLPLFTDEERKIVGTTYKQKSREAAIKIGLDLFGPKMRKMVEEVEGLVSSWRGAVNNEQRPTANCVLIHCWRGGMRSAAVAWLLDLYGFKVYTLAGGYKYYRNHVLKILDYPYDFKVLGGYTGSGKTVVLKELEKSGEQVVDLEAIACHKGSAFGAIGQAAQPTQEMFENLLAMELRKKTGDSTGDRFPCIIWLEDESQRIGLVNIQQTLWKRMRKSPVYFLDIPFEQRLNYVVECYGKLEKEKMVNAIIRIGKRLGGLETKTAIGHLLEDNVKECFTILLKYYDKYYLKGLHNREDGDTLISKIPCEKVDAETNAKKLLEHQRSSLTSNILHND